MTTELTPAIRAFYAGKYQYFRPIRLAGSLLICSGENGGSFQMIALDRRLVDVPDRPAFDAWVSFLKGAKDVGGQMSSGGHSQTDQTPQADGQ